MECFAQSRHRAFRLQQFLWHCISRWGNFWEIGTECITGIVRALQYSLQLSSIQFSSVLYKIVSMRSLKAICAPIRLSEISLTLRLKQFQCSSTDWPQTSVRWRPICYRLTNSLLDRITSTHCLLPSTNESPQVFSDFLSTMSAKSVILLTARLFIPLRTVLSSVIPPVHPYADLSMSPKKLCWSLWSKCLIKTRAFEFSVLIVWVFWWDCSSSHCHCIPSPVNRHFPSVGKQPSSNPFGIKKKTKKKNDFLDPELCAYKL